MRYELTDQVATSRPSAPERMMHAAAIEIARGRHPTDASVAWSRSATTTPACQLGPPRTTPHEIVVGGEHGCNHYVAAIAGQIAPLVTDRRLPHGKSPSLPVACWSVDQEAFQRLERQTIGRRPDPLC